MLFFEVLNFYSCSILATIIFCCIYYEFTTLPFMFYLTTNKYLLSSPPSILVTKISSWPNSASSYWTFPTFLEWTRWNILTSAYLWCLAGRWILLLRNSLTLICLKWFLLIICCKSYLSLQGSILTVFMESYIFYV